MSSSSDESLISALQAFMGQEKKKKKKKKQKTSHQRQKQWEKNEQKHLLNNKLSVLPGFQPLKPYQIIFINYMSAFFVILRLIELATKTAFFSIDTETDDTSNIPALIQIQFIQFDTDEKETTIVIFEMCQLPHMTSIIYPRVQQLVDTIFHPSKTFLAWGNMVKELNTFTKYNLFTSSTIQHLNIVPVQDKFKNWYNPRFPHNSDCYMALSNNINDGPMCTCNHRPYTCPGDRWSLQLAISQTYKEFLDKSSTRSDWGQGLDIRLYQNIQFSALNYNIQSRLSDADEQTRLKLIKYAVDDCLAVTKLAFTIGKIF